MKRHAIRTGEALAISPDAIQRDADGFFFMMGPGVPESDDHGSCIVVHIRGALSHFANDSGDSYESIIQRVGEAIAREPSHVVLRIESPGGVVAGLNESVAKLRDMSKESGIPFVAYIDEMAASAAYAVACSCDTIMAPPAAIVGSVGVISTIASQEKRDKADGLEYVLITSGARKADGHPHGPITDDALDAERARNAELADQFFALVSDSRGIPKKKVAALEAGIFLGRAADVPDAVDVGLVDEVIAFDKAMSLLDTGEPIRVRPNSGNQTTRNATLDNLNNSVSLIPDATPLTSESLTPEEDDMSVKMQALIAKMAKETDPVKVSALLVEYGVAAKAEKPSDDGGEEDDEDEDEGKHAKAAKRAEMSKKKAEAAKHKAAGDEYRRKAAECDEKARGAMGEEDDEEDEEAKAIRADLNARATASGGALAALADRAVMSSDALARVKKLEDDAALKDMRASIHEALSARRITRKQSTMLAEKSPEFVRDYLAMHPKAIVSTDEDQLSQPAPRENADVSPEAMAGIDAMVAALPAALTAEQKAKVRQDMINGRRQVAATNGSRVTGRY